MPARRATSGVLPWLANGTQGVRLSNPSITSPSVPNDGPNAVMSSRCRTPSDNRLDGVVEKNSPTSSNGGEARPVSGRSPVNSLHGPSTAFTSPSSASDDSGTSRSNILPMEMVR